MANRCLSGGVKGLCGGCHVCSQIVVVDMVVEFAVVACGGNW